MSVIWVCCITSETYIKEVKYIARSPVISYIKRKRKLKRSELICIYYILSNSDNAMNLYCRTYMSLEQENSE